MDTESQGQSVGLNRNMSNFSQISEVSKQIPLVQAQEIMETQIKETKTKASATSGANLIQARKFTFSVAIFSFANLNNCLFTLGQLQNKEFQFMLESDYIDNLSNRLKPPVIVPKQSIASYRRVKRP